jgi:hypothetical protein
LPSLAVSSTFAGKVAKVANFSGTPLATLHPRSGNFAPAAAFPVANYTKVYNPDPVPRVTTAGHHQPDRISVRVPGLVWIVSAAGVSFTDPPQEALMAGYRAVVFVTAVAVLAGSHRVGATQPEPKDAAGFVARGFTWMDKGEYDKAIADFTEATKLDPKHANAYANRGYCHEQKRDFDKAISDYTEVIEFHPKSPVGWTNRAWVRATCPDARFRDGKKAVEDARQVCELDGWKSGSALAVLAAAHAESGQFDEAVKWQKKALEDKDFAEGGGELVGLLKLYEAKEPYRTKKH